MPAVRQFVISEAVALAIIDLLALYGIEAKIKWPNDIYVGDRKICGILVEHTVMGKNIIQTIAGIGINVNQTQFLSDAPNPVSMAMLTGEEYPIEKMVSELAEFVEKMVSLIEHGKNIHYLFLQKLWRKDNAYYLFNDKKNTETIKARIKGVTEDGILGLNTESGEQRQYFFKEVEFIL